MTRKWSIVKQHDGSWLLMTELPCINGLSAWFSVALFYDRDESEINWTSGAILSAEEYARAVLAALEG